MIRIHQTAFLLQLGSHYSEVPWSKRKRKSMNKYRDMLKLSNFDMNYSIVNITKWSWHPTNFKGTNKDHKIYLGRSTSVHNLLFCTHTLCVAVKFLLVSSSGTIMAYCVLCTVRAKKANKNTEQRNFAKLRNHLPLVTTTNFIVITRHRVWVDNCSLAICSLIHLLFAVTEIKHFLQCGKQKGDTQRETHRITCNFKVPQNKAADCRRLHIYAYRNSTETVQFNGCVFWRLHCQVVEQKWQMTAFHQIALYHLIYLQGSVGHCERYKGIFFKSSDLVAIHFSGKKNTKWNNLETNTSTWTKSLK